MKQAGLNSKVSITKDFFQNSLFNFQGPARDIRGYSSAGRAPALQAGGQRFDPAYLHHFLGSQDEKTRFGNKTSFFVSKGQISISKCHSAPPPGVLKSSGRPFSMPKWR